MTLSAAADYRIQPAGRVSVPISNGVTIYHGALVGLNAAGDAVNWSAATADNLFFLGTAEITTETGVAASAGEAKTGNASGTVEVAVRTEAQVLKSVTVVGGAANQVGNLVYASDENTFTFTDPGGADPIGFATRHVTGTTMNVYLFSAGEARAWAAK